MACAYCGGSAPGTREHVLPHWIRRELADHDSVTPARGQRHLFQGDLVIADVCASCNNGELSLLDKAAKGYWDSRRDQCETLEDGEANLLARWAAKVCYNAQRAVMILGTAGEEPAMPPSVRDWALGRCECPSDVAVNVARMPPDHPDSQSVGLFGSNGSRLPRRYVQLRAGVFFVAWGTRDVPDASRVIAELDRERAPANSIGQCIGSVGIPLLADPAMVRRGYRNNDELVQRVEERRRKRGQDAPRT